MFDILYLAPTTTTTTNRERTDMSNQPNRLNRELVSLLLDLLYGNTTTTTTTVTLRWGVYSCHHFSAFKNIFVAQFWRICRTDFLKVGLIKKLLTPWVIYTCPEIWVFSSLFQKPTKCVDYWSRSQPFGQSWLCQATIFITKLIIVTFKSTGYP